MIGLKSTNGTWIKESNFPASDTEKEEKIVVKQHTESQGPWQGGNCQLVQGKIGDCEGKCMMGS